MKKKLLLLLFAPLLAGGCSDYLDVNHYPDGLEELPSPRVLLSSAQLNAGATLMGWHFGIVGAMYSQYWTAAYTHAQFKAICEYQPVTMDLAWTNLYTGALINLQEIQKIAAANPDETGSGAYQYIAEALSIFAWQIATDVWGSVPYSEALKGLENLHPKFDRQEDIYADLRRRIDALETKDVSELALPSSDKTYDLIFGGDMAEWKRFAKTLKLKLMLRLSETPGYNNAAVLAYVENNVDSLLTDAHAMLPRTTWNDGQEGKRHPMREFERGSAYYLGDATIACKTFYDYLGNHGDPRLPKLFNSATKKAAFFGDFDSDEDSDGDGVNDDKEGAAGAYAQTSFIGTTAPDVFMDLMLISQWEVNFYIAEVYARNSDMTTAKTYYEDAVRASLTQQGIPTASGAGFNILDAGYAKFDDYQNSELAVKQIAMQKWVAYCNYQHIESFLERNRLHYPAVNEINVAEDRQFAWVNFPDGEFTISAGGRERLQGNLPASPTYPQSVIDRNNNAPSQKKDMGEKVWWNTRTTK